MSHVISKLGFGRIDLMFLLLLCSVFTCENTFSRQWAHNNMMLFYIEEEHAIVFNVLCYDYAHAQHSDVHSYLDIGDIQYSMDGRNFISLITVQTEFQEIKEIIWIKIRNMKPNETINFPLFITPKNKTLLSNNIHQIIGLNLTDVKYQDGTSFVFAKNSYLSVKWNLPKLLKFVKNVKIIGYWSIREMGLTTSRRVYDVYEMNYKKSNINIQKNAPSVLKSEISNEVKVTGKTDAIIVTGAEPGEDIKVYTGSGNEIKSVIATDDVVNIKLLTNQIYIVKAGQVRYKVAL